MYFDYASDLHLDFWVKMTGNERKSNQNIRQFTEAILPERPNNTLILAGDIGHYPAQNHRLFLYLKEVYETIFYVYGNHDYYLVSNQMKKTYRTSMDKVAVTDLLYQSIEGVYRLDGSTMERERDGIIFGGANMWYDLSYNEDKVGEEAIYQKWCKDFNDRNFQVGLPYPKEHAKREKEKVKDIICDVFVSHVPPIGMPLPEQYVAEAELPLYTFDAIDLFQAQKPKVWVSGHMHQVRETMIDGVKHLVNAIGYPEKANDKPKRIQQYRS